MRAVVQRVSRAQVSVAGEVLARIGPGLCVLVGAGAGDGDEDVRYIADKIGNLRIFPDDEGRMNRSVLDVGGGVLAISQFTLYGDARKGRRPSFVKALEPEAAEALVEALLARLESAGIDEVGTGRFGADMQVELVNDGPVTILLDSGKAF